MPANTSVTNTSDTDTDTLPEVLLTPAQAKTVLRVLSTEKIEAIAQASTGFATKDVTNQTPASILAKTNAVFAANKLWSLAIK
jgi:hypothetical protein